MIMDSSKLLSVIVAIMASMLFAEVISQESCSVCNCQFNNVQVLDQLIEGKVNTSLTGVSGAGATYIRWGKSSCPSTSGTELVYAGRAGGTYYNTVGGAANKVCLPEDPDYLAETSGYSVSSTIWGAEYEFGGHPHSSLTDYNVPCAVCYVSTRVSVLMIPAKTQCPSSWTREYYGYLTAEHDSHRRSSFECVDNIPEAISGSSSHLNGALFYYAGVTCNAGLDCPPYQNNRILSCAVCTK